MDTPAPSLKDQGSQALRDGDLDRAVDCLARAVMADDRDVDAKALLGVAYSQKGLHAEAKRELIAAVEGQPQNPDFRFNLGAVLERAGDIQGAAVAYSETLRLHSQHEQATARLAAMGMRVQVAPTGLPPPGPSPAPVESAVLPPPVAAPPRAAPDGIAPSPPAPQYPSVAPPPIATVASPPAAPLPPQPMQYGTVQCPHCRRSTRLGPTCEFCMAPLAAVALSPEQVGWGPGVRSTYFKPHRGGLILGLGLGGLVFNMTCGLACGITGLVGLALAISAWIMGNGDLREMDAGLMDPSGRGLVQAGRIVGMINCGLAALAAMLLVGYFLLILTIGLAGGTK